MDRIEKRGAANRAWITAAGARA